MTTKEQIEFLESLTSGRIISAYDVEKFTHIRQNLSGRLQAGRPKIHASERERWRFHNAKRREKKRRLKNTEKSLDIADANL